MLRFAADPGSPKRNEGEACCFRGAVCRPAASHGFDKLRGPRFRSSLVSCLRRIGAVFPVAIVPGAGVWGKDTLSHVLEDRVLTAIALYRAKRVKKLLFFRAARYDRL